MGWAGHVADMGEIINVGLNNILAGKLGKKETTERLNVHGITVLKWLLKRVWTGFDRIRIGFSDGIFKRG